jgi:antitoxin YefM
MSVKTSYSIQEAKSRLPALVRRAESGGLVAITRRNRAVAYMMGAQDLASLIETMEVMGNPAARAAMADAEAGRGRAYSLNEIASRRLIPRVAPGRR